MWSRSRATRLTGYSCGCEQESGRFAARLSPGRDAWATASNPIPSGTPDKKVIGRLRMVSRVLFRGPGRRRVPSIIPLTGAVHTGSRAGARDHGAIISLPPAVADGGRALFRWRGAPDPFSTGRTSLENCLGLHAVGFAMPRLSPIERCALTAPFHPYPATKSIRWSL